MSLLSPAPDAPATFSHTNVVPDTSHGPKVNLTWSKPIKTNGIIRSYTLFYGHERDQREETFGKDTFSYSVDVLGGLTYQFHVRAVTIKPGKNASLAVNVPEYGRFSFFFFFLCIHLSNDTKRERTIDRYQHFRVSGHANDIVENTFL